jgi:biotin operon repressor
MSETERNTSGATASPIWGKDFIETYITVADQESHDNPKMHLGFSLGLLGECLRDGTFKNGSESCRVHPLMLQGSGSGKESAFDVAEEIADRVNARLDEEMSFDFYGVDNITSGNLVGTHADGQHKQGIADQYDIIGLREAKDLFSHSDMRRRLRILMDEEEVTREMREGTIHVDSSCTVMGTIPPDEINAGNVSDLVGEGTLARPLYFFKEVNLTDTQQTVNQILTATSCDQERENSIGEERQEELKRRLCATLAQLAEHYSGGINFELALDEQTLKSEIWERMEAELEYRSEAVRRIVQPMLTRYAIHALRIACIMAALDNCSHTVEQKHLKQATIYWHESFSSMLDYFSRRQGEISGLNKRAMQRQRDKAEDMLDLLVEIVKRPNVRQARLAEKLRSSRETIRKHAEELEQRGVIEVHNTGNSAQYVLVDNSRNGDLGNY